MRMSRLGRILIASSLFFCGLALLGSGDARQEFADETGLDIDLIGVVKADVGGSELTVVFVYINERTFSSKISSTLRQRLLPFVGRNALYVNPSIKAVVDWFAFSSHEISVRQDGRTIGLSLEDWVEITPGFSTGRFEVNPAGPSKGSGSEGILVLGDAIDGSRPFEVFYRGASARLEIGSGVSAATGEAARPAAASASHDPVSVAPLQDLSGLQDVLMHEQFSEEGMAALFGLDLSDIAVMRFASRGEELRLLLIRLDPEVRESALGPDLIETVEPLIGTGAVMVWAFSPTGAEFSPWHFYVNQSGTNYVFFSTASFVELTSGFIRIRRVEAGEVAAGVIRLPKGVLPSLPFSVFYGTTGAEFP